MSRSINRFFNISKTDCPVPSQRTFEHFFSLLRLWTFLARQYAESKVCRKSIL